MTHESEQVFYKISELSDALEVETSVLRFWEKEFPQIRPMKVGQRKRLYRRKDLETFQEIKRLLYEERFTIAGARKRLAKSEAEARQGRLFDDLPARPEADAPRRAEPAEAGAAAGARTDSPELLAEIRQALVEIRNILTGGAGRF